MAQILCEVVTETTQRLRQSADSTDYDTEHQVMKPKAIGLVRPDKSGLAAPKRATDIRRYAEHLGYRYLYTVRPPECHDDPVGYALNLVLDISAAALVVYDLDTVDNTPARICDVCDLETVCPPTTWAVALPEIGDSTHAHPDHPLTAMESHRIMQQHITCRAVVCPRKASALGCLVRAGKLVPPVDTPRGRAAARGLPYPVADNAHPPAVGADTQTLLDVLDALNNPDTGTCAVAAGCPRSAWVGG